MNFKEFIKKYEELNEGKKKKHILTSRRSKEERAKHKLIADYQKVKQYIKNGSKGDLNLERSLITSLPNNLKTIGGDLVLKNSLITFLPCNLTVKGTLNLYQSLITVLPDNLSIGKNLNLSHSSITALPHDLKVKRALIIVNTPLSKKYTKVEMQEMSPNINLILTLI
jgi:hypothetical protein